MEQTWGAETRRHIIAMGACPAGLPVINEAQID
jgi:hypothetical protein